MDRIGIPKAAKAHNLRRPGYPPTPGWAILPTEVGTEEIHLKCRCNVIYNVDNLVDKKTGNFKREWKCPEKRCGWKAHLILFDFLSPETGQESASGSGDGGQESETTSDTSSDEGPSSDETSGTEDESESTGEEEPRQAGRASAVAGVHREKKPSKKK
jgi:hypothetical protein